MHNTLQSIKNTVKKLERRSLTEEKQKLLAAFIVIIDFFQKKQERGLALTREDEIFLKSLEMFILGMVKDSSIT